VALVKFSRNCKGSFGGHRIRALTAKEIRWNKYVVSRQSLETSINLRPSSVRKEISVEFIGPSVSKAKGWKMYVTCDEYLADFLATACSAAPPGLAESVTWDSASVLITVTFDAIALPACQGIKVLLSGHLPSTLTRPDGFFTDGRWPCTRPARQDRWSHDGEPSCQRANDMTGSETLKLLLGNNGAPSNVASSGAVDLKEPKTADFITLPWGCTSWHVATLRWRPRLVPVLVTTAVSRSTTYSGPPRAKSFMKPATSGDCREFRSGWTVRQKSRGPNGSPCCGPYSDHITCSSNHSTEWWVYAEWQ